MTHTTLSPLLKKLADDWAKQYKSAKCSGILPDPAHERRGGFHVGRQFNPAGNYSIVRPDDKAGSETDANAIDMTMSAADMRLCTSRLVAAWKNTSDPRRKYINAFNGTLDGKRAQRWDVYARSVKAASADHVWHVHLEVRRRYSRSPAALAAILSIIKGQSVADYVKWATGGLGGSVKTSSTASATVTSAPSPKPPAFPGVLRRDDQQKEPSLALKVLQQQLLRRGLTSIGAADGFFGPKMEAGVKVWQKRVGLPADGIVGKMTWPTPWTAA